METPLMTFHRCLCVSRPRDPQGHKSSCQACTSHCSHAGAARGAVSPSVSLGSRGGTSGVSGTGAGCTRPTAEAQLAHRAACRFKEVTVMDMARAQFTHSVLSLNSSEGYRRRKQLLHELP